MDGNEHKLKIPLADIEAGMIVADAVFSEEGDLLIKTGVEIDEYYIRILHRYKIQYINITKQTESEPESPPDIEIKPKYTHAEIQKKKNEIEQRKKMAFKYCLDDTFMQTFFKTICEIKLEEFLDE